MTRYSLDTSPLLPWPAIIGLALAAVLVVALGIYAGQRRSALLRALALALILLALLDPSFVREDRQSEKDVVAVVLDRSGSQTIGDRAAQTNHARDLLQKQFQALGTVEPRFIEANRTDAGNDGTKLFAALNAGLADVPPERIGAVLMVTDGLVDDIPADAALGFRAPLHVLVTGREGERDRRIELTESPRFGLVGKDQTIGIRVLDTGDKGEPVEVQVRHDGVPIAILNAAVGTTIDIPVRIDHAGPNVVEIEVPALPNELTSINNKAVVTIDGVRDKLKVLLVSGEPHQGERMWRNILKSDANVDLVHFTILRPPEKQDGTPINELALIAFPTSELFGNKIKDFDLIIFDRFSNQSILPYSYFENIAHYVREGGALLMATGPDYSTQDGLWYSPLGAVSPARPTGEVTEQPFRASVTTDGDKHPVTRGLPGAERSPPSWAPWFRQVDASVVKGTEVMAGSANKPLLVLSHEEKGRVALMLSDQMWLWARDYQGGGPYLDLFRRLAHWLMKEPELEDEALRAKVQGRDLVIERQSVTGETAPLVVTAPSGAQQTVALQPSAPGLSRATVTTDELGLYRVTNGSLSALASVGPENPREFQDVVSTTDRLAAIASATGGTVNRIASGAGDAVSLPRLVSMHAAPSYGGADYIGIRRTDSSVVRGVGLFPVAIGFAGLFLLLGSIVLSWLGEGRRLWRRPALR